MTFPPTSLGRTGLVLILANEIRGVAMVAALLAGGGGAGLQLQRLEAVQASAACAIAPALCGPMAGTSSAAG